MCELGRDGICWAASRRQRSAAWSGFHGRPLLWPRALWIVNCIPVLQRRKLRPDGRGRSGCWGCQSSGRNGAHVDGVGCSHSWD